MAIAGVATLVNLAVGVTLVRTGERQGAITLEADGRHLLTDVWTSVGVLVGIGLVAITGFDRLDPIVALAVSANIVITGVGLVRRSVAGFMDRSLPEAELAAIRAVLSSYAPRGIDFHALRTRQAGRRSFVEVHVLVPGDWSVQRGHDLAEEIEREIRGAVPGAVVLTHIEPVEDRASFADVDLDLDRDE